MKTPAVPQDICLHIPPKMWQEFRLSMMKYQQYDEEAIGFLFCKRHQVSKNKIRYIPKAWIVPLPECYELQSASGLVLKQQFHSYLIENYLEEGLHVIHIHTHVSHTMLDFSLVDDCHESEYSRFLTSKFAKKPRLISGVCDESLRQTHFRIWDRKGKSYQKIRFYQSWFEIPKLEKSNDQIIADPRSINQQDLSSQTNSMFIRQQIFGDACQKQLGELKVGLIGCGGIGSIFVELLGRLGVKNWVLIDPDRLEMSNLNRIPGATKKMSDQRWHKVDYVKYLIKKIYETGSCVKAMPVSIDDEVAQQEIACTDLIVVATDNHLSRKITQELALKYMRPLVCLGTHIEVNQSDNRPRMFCRITVPPLGGGWCLMCGNMINLQRAALESAPVEINQIVEKAGYIEGINDPAVFWLNSICASTAVSVIHGLVSGFLNLDNGIDWIFDFPNWHKTNVGFLETPDCYFCGFKKPDLLFQH